MCFLKALCLSSLMFTCPMSLASPQNIPSKKLCQKLFNTRVYHEKKDKETVPATLPNTNTEMPQVPATLENPTGGMLSSFSIQLQKYLNVHVPYLPDSSLDLGRMTFDRQGSVFYNDQPLSEASIKEMEKKCQAAYPSENYGQNTQD